MISPIFTTIVIGFLAIMIYMKSSATRFNTGDEKRIREESIANSVRKQSLDELGYINIPFESLPFKNLPESSSESSPVPSSEISPADPVTTSPEDILKIDEANILKLKDSKIVNFTGISNTDLKLKYGAPNLTVLSEYDHNFTDLVKYLDKWAEDLLEQGFIEDARKVLEFAIECRTDLKSSYTNLADIYVENFEFDKLDHITEIAGELNSIMKEPIIRALKEKGNINQYMKKKK
ncbi:MAG: hypothetical protein K6E98_10895 [Lachnospiraceae bacterium]|nr:hypothetical protein [Lachnospiraceae bacterium]